jgi:hypothetical protein
MPLHAIHGVLPEGATDYKFEAEKNFTPIKPITPKRTVESREGALSGSA